MNHRPNIVFVLTDDQGYPPLGCHGHPLLRTPNLDQFHGEAVRFEDFHVGSTCAPTRAGILTGHICNSTGVWHTIGGRSLLRRNEWSLADALREHGYRTGLFGKWHLGDEYPYRPQDRGFDSVVCHGGGGISQQPDWWGNDYFDDTYQANGEPRQFQGYCTDVFFDEGIRFMEACTDAQEPFFCYISTNAPHSPFNVESSYWQPYAEHVESENYARFLGMCSNIDGNFGRLRATLTKLGIEEDTIVIFMSDNGQTGTGEKEDELYNADMRGLKGSPYEGGHRVPFLLRWPGGGFAETVEVSALTSYVDFMPTLLHLCGVEVPPERTFHGESLVPLMHGQIDDHWSERIAVTDTQRVAHPVKWRQSCVMQGRWRLVNDELFNLTQDPGQTTDVAAEYPERVASLREGYEQWWRLCSESMDEEVPIPIGVPGREEVVLRTHDLRNEDSEVVWNQAQVRQGEQCLGWWEIDVERPGRYAFELKRWPREASHRIAGGVEGEDVCFRPEDIAPDAESLYRGGKALPIEQATLLLSDGIRAAVPVRSADVGAVLLVDLQPGPRHVRAMFSNSAGLQCSAYYVHIRHVGTANS